ncbi:asparagine synthase (glutamine-hydrolyzing) [Microvirga mediterraneensis]|uniref:asparagine synthase (glutamine-hydrolyzing) n=1 Tax=Microvirga mediterraneensis TaxID=2754695 RepID=A0A838BSM2_9HYPH|nr:asparagine synthase (glutamine-hydrolyzing) [Microvirga mediterraneensis]MBA1157446.1 asparagine synthase (glutamine-hydrolyzing) [Microvirga mediterraneensis]
MCGIAGWVLANRHALPESFLDVLLESMEHRGPDGSGTFMEWTSDSRYQIALGHRRLAIIDIEGGPQPMADGADVAVITYNGEIYNYLELRQELEAKGHTFRTDSDTEVLLEAYKAWGEECVLHFRGMFAFVIYDRRDQSLFLARDHFGKKPFYLLEQADGFFFASELPSLLNVPGINKELNQSAFTNYLVDRYVQGPDTLFSAIRKLSPGCCATWRAGVLKEHRYYSPPFSTSARQNLSYEDSVDALREGLSEAVAIRLRSDAPYGAFLSGGLDSSAIVALMTRHVSSPIRTYSVGFEEDGYSELGYAREVADCFETQHQEVVVSTDEFFDAWPDALAKRGAPISQSSDIPLFLLARAARRDVKMVLSGEGADELLGGYPKYQADPWISVYHRLVPQSVHRYLLAPALSHLPYSMQRLKVLGRALDERDFNRRLRVWFGGLSRERFEQLSRKPFPNSQDDVFPFSSDPGLGNARRARFFDQTSWLPDNLLERGDRMLMAFGVEGRMPFMDVALTDLAATFPERAVSNKKVLRSLMQDLLPANILARKKAGFIVPLDVWFRGRGRTYIQDLLASNDSEIRRLCDTATIDLMLSEHLSERHNHQQILWSLANMELFLRTFKPSMAHEGLSRANSNEPIREVSLSSH